MLLDNSTGTEYTASGISTLSVSGNAVKLLLTSGFTSYIATADISEGDTTLYSTLAFQIKSANAYEIARTVTGSPNATVTVQGVSRDFSSRTFALKSLTADMKLKQSSILQFPFLKNYF